MKPETPESGLENSEDTDMIIDDPVDPKPEEKSPILIEGLVDTIPKIQKQKIVVNVEVTSAKHPTGVSGAILTTGLPMWRCMPWT